MLSMSNDRYKDEAISHDHKRRKFFQTEKSKNRFGVSPKGVHLSIYELNILYELFQFRILNTKQLQILHENCDSIKEDTLRKKLNRWDSREIIQKINVGKRKGFGNDINLYRIDKNGIKILVQEKILSEESLNTDISSLDKIKNIDHFIATNHNVLQTKLKIEQQGFPTEKANYLNETNKKFGIISDGILKVNDVIIYIETDMGTESLTELNDKLYRYANLARAYKDHTHIVAISFLDETYQTRKYYEVKGDRRKANLKKLNIFNDDIFEPNFKVTLSDFNDTPNIIFSSMLDSYKKDILTNLNKFARLLVEKERIKIKQIANQEVYSKRVLDIHQGLNIFCEIYSQAGNLAERIAVLIMNKNDLHLSIIMNNLINYVNDNVFLRYINRLIIVYPTKEELERDMYGVAYSNKIIFTDLESMKEDNEEVYFISKSAYKLKRVPYIF